MSSCYPLRQSTSHHQPSSCFICSLARERANNTMGYGWCALHARTQHAREQSKRKRATQKKRGWEKESTSAWTEMLHCPTEQTYQDARERDIVRSCCFISLLFSRVKMKGKDRGGCFFVVEREKKSRKRRNLPRVLFPSCFLPFQRRFFQLSQ